MELYQKIEALIGLRMEAYPAEQEAVLLLLERVGEAQRIATMQASGLGAVLQAEWAAGWRAGPGVGCRGGITLLAGACPPVPACTCQAMGCTLTPQPQHSLHQTRTAAPRFAPLSPQMKESDKGKKGKRKGGGDDDDAHHRGLQGAGGGGGGGKGGFKKRR